LPLFVTSNNRRSSPLPLMMMAPACGLSASSCRTTSRTPENDTFKCFCILSEAWRDMGFWRAAGLGPRIQWWGQTSYLLPMNGIRNGASPELMCWIAVQIVIVCKTEVSRRRRRGTEEDAVTVKENNHGVSRSVSRGPESVRVFRGSFCLNCVLFRSPASSA
jgi:hypothetical protein